MSQVHRKNPVPQEYLGILFGVYRSRYEDVASGAPVHEACQLRFAPSSNLPSGKDLNLMYMFDTRILL